MHEALRGRLIGAFTALLFVIGSGTLTYYLLGDGRWTVSECLYMTMITITTVGFGEVAGFEDVRGFTIILLVFGMGTFLYFASTVTAIIIEGDLSAALRRTRMRKKIANLEDHFIVCGAGSTGRHVIEELLVTGKSVVAIDCSLECLEPIQAAFPKADFYFIVGDATDDEVFESARLSTARGIIAALANDKDNLYLVVSARQVNPEARIVARGSDLKVLEKLKKAGADTVVSPNYIGGMRMVSELIRPEVVRFLDVMLRDKRDIRIEEVRIPSDSSLKGKTLADANIRESCEVSVLAAQSAGCGDYVYSPRGEFEIDGGMTLVVLGPVANVDKLRKLARP